jgi:DNA-binding response OmpR family regulator
MDQDIRDVRPGRNVLCIEDEHFISELYTRALNRSGYRVKTIVDGVEGLKEAQTDRYDIILLDLMLPNLTGVEILRQLKDPSKPQIKAKIIVTTNLEQREDVKADIERQADAYVVKAEMTPGELVEFINSIK